MTTTTGLRGYLPTSVEYALRRHPDGMTARKLARELDEPAEEVLEVLEQLEAEHKVGRPYGDGARSGHRRWHLRCVQ